MGILLGYTQAGSAGRAGRRVGGGGRGGGGRKRGRWEEEEEGGGRGARGDMSWAGVVRFEKGNKKQVKIKMKERVSPVSSKQP